MRDISKWFEARSSEQDSAGIRQRLDNLIGQLTGTASARRQEDASGPEAVYTVPDPKHPDDPV